MTKNSKELILQQAYDLFSKNGFSGTSIKMIADGLNISTSLIFHHFKSKEELWVNTELFATSLQEHKINVIREDSLENFLNDLLSLRMEWYRDKKFRTFFHWRALEKNPQDFADVAKKSKSSEFTALNIPLYVSKLQDKGIVRKDLDPQVIATMIFSNSSYAIWDYATYYNMTSEQITTFKKLSLQTLLNVFKP